MIPWNGYTDPETGYDADDIPEGGWMGLEELRAVIHTFADSDNIYCVAGAYSVSSDALIGIDWADTVGGFRQRWGF